MSKRDKYLAKMKEQFDGLNLTIDELGDKTQQLTDETLIKYDKQISGLMLLGDSPKKTLQAAIFPGSFHV